MKEIYLTKDQIKRLSEGKQVTFSRGGRQFMLASKEMKNNVESARQKEIRELKEKIAMLEKGTAADTLRKLKQCPHCKKSYTNLGQHIGLKHGGRKSNLPQVRARQISTISV